MSETEKSLQDFLQRWSRRKLGLEERSNEVPEAPAELNESCAPNPNSDTFGASSDGGVEPFDLARLPPIESIDPSTDIRAFLAPGIPVELARAALRRAWLSDPAIRDFVGLAENQWDFTNPNAVPGFGSLELTPELRSLVAGLFGEPSAKDIDASDTESAKNAVATASPEALPPDPAAAALPGSVEVSRSVAVPTELPTTDAALQNNSIHDEPPTPNKPKHGGALPK